MGGHLFIQHDKSLFIVVDALLYVYFSFYVLSVSASNLIGSTTLIILEQVALSKLRIE